MVMEENDSCALHQDVREDAIQTTNKKITNY